MSLRMRIYYHTLFGATGGYLGWFLIHSYFNTETASQTGLLARDAQFGAVVGVCLGALLGCTEGVRTRSIRKLAMGVSVGAVVGALAGTIGLTAGELIYGATDGGMLSRAAGWALFGMLVGTAEGIARRAPRRCAYGAFGGVLGGFVGGATCDRTTDLMLQFTGDRDLALALGGMVGLMVLGAAIASLIALVEVVLGRAKLRVMNGRHEGSESIIDRKENRIGGSGGCEIVLSGDTSVEKIHAVIRQENGRFRIQNLDPEGRCWVNQQKVDEAELRGSDRIKVGNTMLVFLEEGTPAR